MSTRLPKNLSPASKLYHDVLYEIFLANVAWEETKQTYTSSVHHVNGWYWECSPLRSTRYASQVCHVWRETLLDSPSIWAKCIHLDLLDQKEDHWRDLVMKRTRSSHLSIMGGTRSSYNGNNWEMPTESVGSKLLGRLFEEDYSRIRHFAVRMQPKFFDNPQTWKALNRPWVSLQEFTLDIIFNMPTKKALGMPSDIRLFGNLAPSLTVLSLPLYLSMVPVCINMSAKNMRVLDLVHQSIEVNNVDLICACRHMPYLEILRLQISVFIVTDSKESKYNDQSVYLPYLNTITIDADTLEIFPAFLDYMFPMMPCTLRSTISNTYMLYGSSPTSHTMTDQTDAMARVVKRFSASWAIDTRGAEQYSLEEVLHIHVLLSGSFRVESHPPGTPSHKRHKVALSFNGGIPLWMFQSLIDGISFDDPTAFTGLHLYTSSRHDVHVLSNRPSMAYSLVSLQCVTELTIPSSLLPYLNLVGEEDIILFPRLRTLNVIMDSNSIEGTPADEEKEQIELLLSKRHYTSGHVDQSRHPPSRAYAISVII